MKSGCNGIDMFAGSFGLVSGDELVQVARGAAQGASLYFFNLAMSSVCPSCKEVMDNISKKIEQLNQWGRNSCENAIKFADDTVDASAKVKSLVQFNGYVD
ncbi:conjugal transfer protein TraH [Colwellia sp. MSW7]|uniref:Conjugal transfer protein TraH n=1 Tax=Colwellia maritima TaxID=2912588 RepID=A0ABS9X744_9GAMM|nr:conjugal transfer protein TraH [Colwellia maritima]MCI2286042.1 conjugal transfer protein TraH [Colwellia maritima]